MVRDPTGGSGIVEGSRNAPRPCPWSGLQTAGSRGGRGSRSTSELELPDPNPLPLPGEGGGEQYFVRGTQTVPSDCSSMSTATKYCLGPVCLGESIKITKSVNIIVFESINT
jgi:hypothetical protein